MRSTRQLARTAAALTLALAVAVAAAGCASSAQRSAAAGASTHSTIVPRPTARHDFAPASAAALKSAAIKHAKGSCWTTSIAVPKAGAYRCLASNKILDPCYAKTAAAKTVVCYDAPWSEPEKLTLTAALPPLDGALPTSHPWALRLSNGLRCVTVTGTVQVAGNIALTYSCGGDQAAGLSQSSGALLAAYYRASAAAPLQNLAVTDTWYG
jgi:hypothetical protein